LKIASATHLSKVQNPLSRAPRAFSVGLSLTFTHSLLLLLSLTHFLSLTHTRFLSLPLSFLLSLSFSLSLSLFLFILLSSGLYLSLSLPSSHYCRPSVPRVASVHNCEFKYLLDHISGRMPCAVVRPEVSRCIHIYIYICK